MVDKTKLAEKFIEFFDIMKRLRAPGGCPWDREQDYLTLKRYIIEEAYELIEAVDGGNPSAICEECGDLMLQVVFVSCIAEELGDFDVTDVLDGISRKLIRRHPHVFGDIEAKSSDEVLRNWEQIKAAERKEKKEDPSVLAGVPRGLPSLLRASRMQERAAKIGFDWPPGNIMPVLAKVEEEINELKEAIAVDPGSAKVSAELGDVFFALANLSRHLKIEPESAAHRACKKFDSRFRFVEKKSAATGRPSGDFTLEELEGYWISAKQREKV